MLVEKVLFNNVLSGDGSIVMILSNPLKQNIVHKILTAEGSNCRCGISRYICNKHTPLLERLLEGT